MNYLIAASSMFPPSWDQFVPSIIATFIGFVLALIGDYFLQTGLEKRKQTKEVNDLFSRLLAELEDMKTVLEGLNEYTLEKNPLKTPVWDEAINVGLISLIETNLRKSLFTIYKKLEELDSWYAIKTNYYFSHPKEPYNNELNNEIKKQVDRLLGEEKYDDKTLDSEKITIDMVINFIKKSLSKSVKQEKKN